MASIIVDRQIVEDDWQLIACDDNPVIPAQGKIILPLGLFLARRDEWLARAQGEALGIWLEGQENPEGIVGDLKHFSLVAIHFPRFADGRGYSLAYLLRTRHGYQGELRAIGDILRDQLYYLQRVGFNAFVVRTDKDIEDALSGLDDFTQTYQASSDQPLPLFRRRAILLGGQL